jgi:hypothetical protein
MSPQRVVLAPVNSHRTLFRQKEKDWLVLVGNRCVRACLLLSAVAVIGVVWLIFDFVVGNVAGVAATAVAVLAFLGTWFGIPLVRRLPLLEA